MNGWAQDDMKKLEAMESRVKAFFEEVASCINEIECIDLTLKGFQILGQGLQAFALDNAEDAKVQGGEGKGSDDGAGMRAADCNDSCSDDDDDDEDGDMDISISSSGEDSGSSHESDGSDEVSASMFSG